MPKIFRELKMQSVVALSYRKSGQKRKRAEWLASCGLTGGFVCCSPDTKKKKKRFCSSLADPISVAAQDVGQRGFLQYYYSFFRCTYYMAVFCVMTFLDSSLSLL